jgi:hypothetical protein
MDVTELKAAIHSGKYHPSSFTSLTKALADNDMLSEVIPAEELANMQESPDDRLGVIANRLAMAAFQTDLGQALGLGAHPRYKYLFSLAWSYGHAHGPDEVLHYAQQMAGLISVEEPAEFKEV